MIQSEVSMFLETNALFQRSWMAHYKCRVYKFVFEIKDFNHKCEMNIFY